MSHIRPFTKPAPQWQITSQHFAPLPIGVQCFNAVLFGSNGNLYTISMQSDMCTHKHVLHNTETLVGQNKYINSHSSECRVPKKFFRVPFLARMPYVRQPWSRNSNEQSKSLPAVQSHTEWTASVPRLVRTRYYYLLNLVPVKLLPATGGN